MYVGNPEVLDELVFARESDRALSWRRRTTRLLPNLRETCGKFEKTFRIFPEFRGVCVISRPFLPERRNGTVLILIRLSITISTSLCSIHSLKKKKKKKSLS